jgi:hypothetical protein
MKNVFFLSVKKTYVNVELILLYIYIYIKEERNGTSPKLRELSLLS